MFLKIVIIFTLFLKIVFTRRIIGGINSLPNEYPFVVSIRFGDMHICGGSLIKNQFILTAAHCFDENQESENYKVYFGNYQLLEGKPIEVQSIRRHENYIGQKDYWQNDIAILKINEPLNITIHVQVVHIQKLPVKGNESLEVVGWGTSLDSSFSFPNILQKLRVKQVQRDECKKLWSSSVDSHLCFWNGPNIQKGICRGDSGGPLLLDKKLVGILSWTPYICTDNKPDVATRIAPYFLDWIYKNLK